MVPVFYHEYFPPPDVGVDCSVEPSRTKQSFRDECDINVIMERLVPGDEGGPPPVYGDFSSVTDFQQSMEIIAEAQQQFEVLPSRVRERFANDPARMLAFLDDASNLKEAVELGLCSARPEPVAKEAPPKAEPEIPK
ncbi:hypothetical protein CCP3SC15_2050005 [Gammaproteobacteria bacterium]